MKKDYRSMLPSGDSLMLGGNGEERQKSVSPQEKQGIVLQVINNKEKGLSGNRQPAFFDQKEYERRVKVIVEGRLLEDSVKETASMLKVQLGLLNGIPLDAMRNNSSKLVNQDMDVAPLEDMNLKARETLQTIARNLCASSLMMRYVENLRKKERERWQLSELDKAMAQGGDKACAYIERKAGSHLTRLASRMEWFPVAYHLIDKVALVVLPVLGYYTGKYQLNDTMVFLWSIAAMPVLAMSAIWGINELWGWVERKKAKLKSH